MRAFVLSILLIVSVNSFAIDSNVRLPPKNPNELKVLNFNAWLLSLRGDARNSAQSRLALMKPEIESLAPDVITFQEVWGGHYREEVKKLCESIGLSFTGFHSEVPVITPGVKLTTASLGTAAIAGTLAYRAYQNRKGARHRVCDKVLHSASLVGGTPLAMGSGGLGVALMAADQIISRDFGNGLFFCSRHPIGKMESFNYDDWTAPEEFALYRSVVKLEVRLPDFGPVQIFSTHLGPIGFDREKGSFKEQDVVNNDKQFEQMLRWIERESNPKVPLILTGDLNINLYESNGREWKEPQARRYRQLIEGTDTNLKLKDSYGEMNGRPFPPPLLSATDGPFNANVFLHEGVDKGNVHPSQILDYIFYNGRGKLQAISSSVVLNKRYSSPNGDAGLQYEQMYGKEFPAISTEEQEALRKKFNLETLPLHLSDHFGVMSTFLLQRK